MLRVRKPSSHSEQVLRLTAAVIFWIFTRLWQKSSSEVSCSSHCLLQQTVWDFQHGSTFSMFANRNSSSRERSDHFERSDRGVDRFDRRDERRDDRHRLQLTKRSFSREKEERSRERDQSGSSGSVSRVASMTDKQDGGSKDRARSKEKGRLSNFHHLSLQENCVQVQFLCFLEALAHVWSLCTVDQEPFAAPSTQTSTKPALTEEEVDKKSTAIIEEYLHINDMKVCSSAPSNKQPMNCFTTC